MLFLFLIYLILIFTDLDNVLINVMENMHWDLRLINVWKVVIQQINYGSDMGMSAWLMNA